MAASRSILVTLRANVQDFKNQFDAASQAADRTSKSTEEAGQKAETAMGRMVQSATQNRQAWTTAGTALAGFGAAVLGAGVMAARTGVAYNQLQQRAGSALETLMGSAEAAAVQMSKLNDFADNSPFQREIFIEAQQQLIAFGTEAERVVPILSAVQDAVAATGGSNQDITELVNIIAKVGSTGKITAQTLNELGYRGVDAATLIGEQMGKTGAQIREEITAGTLDADEALQALTDGMSEKFGGAAAGMRETFDGAIDRVRAAWRDLTAELMTPLVSPDGGGLLVDLANNLADFMRSIEAMPAPVRNAGAAIAGLSGAAALAAGSFLLLMPRLLDTIEAGKILAGDFPRVAAALGTVARGAVKLGAVVGVATVATVAIQKLTDSIRGIDRASFDVGVDALVTSLREGERTGDMFTSTLGDMYDSGVLNKQMFDDLGGTITEVSDINWFQNLIGPFAATGINEAKDRLADLGSAFTELAHTDLAQAQDAFSAFYDEAVAGGATFEEIMGVMPGFREALVGIALDAGLATDDATLLRLATGELKPTVDEATGAIIGLADGTEELAAAAAEAAEATDTMRSSLFEAAQAAIDAERGMLDYAEALEEATELAKDNSGAWEDGTQAARDNKNELLDLAEQALATADALATEGKPSGTFLRQAREDLIDVATEMTGSREAAERYVDQLLGTPAEITTLVNLEAEEAQARWAAIYAELWPSGGHPPMVIEAEIDPDENLPRFTGLIDTIPPETNTDVNVDADEAAEKAWGFQGVIEGATEDQDVNVTADVEPAQWEVNQLNTAIDEAGGTVTINGDSVPADQALDIIMGIINSSDGTVTIDGMTIPADQALGHIIGIINSSDGTVTIDGDNAPANSATEAAERFANEGHGTMMIGGDPSDAFGAVGRATSHANRSRGSISVSAVTSAANAAINHAARRRFTTIQVNYSGIRSNLMAGAGRAMGGPIHGPGTGTSDSVPIMASNGEHMWTANEVSRAGGHQAMYNLRQQIMAGARSLHLATGGGIENGSVAPARAMPAYQQGQQRSGPVTATLPPGLIASEIRQGFESATVIAQVSDRVAAQLHQRGKSASRAFGGAK